MCDENSTAKKRCLTTVSDNCVAYTGPDIPALGITKDCADLRLSDIEAIIIQRLLDLVDGTGISLESITGNCDFVTSTLVNSDKSLASLIQLLFNNDCTLHDYIATVEAKLEPPFAFDLKCLTTVAPENPSRNQIIQALIDNDCANTAAIATINNQLANDDTEDSILNAVRDIIGNMVSDMLTSSQGNLVKTGAGVNAKVNIIADNPIGTINFGKYDLTNFDSTGLGVAGTDKVGWALCNGNNGTEDMRGFTPVGTLDMLGGSYNPIVNPGTDPDLVAAYSSTKGKNKYTLLPSQLPDHNHNVTITQTPHTHNIQVKRSGNGGGGSPSAYGSNFGDPYTIATDQSTVGLSILVGGVTGTSGQPIDVRQPSKYLRFIQRIA